MEAAYNKSLKPPLFIRDRDKRVEISFTDNITKRLIDVINPAIFNAKRLKLAVAFVKYSGLSLIEINLKKCLDNGGEMEFLVGLDFRMTEPRALRTLVQLSDQGFRVKCYCFSEPSTKDTPIYHPKLYLIMNNQTALINIGSSNLTQGGLRDNVELNAVITASLAEEIVSEVYALYNRLKFQQKRFEPDREYIEKYEEAYGRIQKRDVETLQERKTKEIIKELKEKEEVLPRPVPTGLELFGWQKIVYESLPLGEFRTSDMYAYEKEFQRHYPENRHVRAKVRQILQQLEDIGLIKHPRRDKWARI